MAKTKMLSVREAAILRGVSLKAIRDLLYVGRLQGARKLGREWRIPRSALENYNQSVANRSG